MSAMQGGSSWQAGFLRFFRPPRDDALNEVARRMDENEKRWSALEAELPPRITVVVSEETERDKRLRAARAWRDRLGQRNIWYRKDENGVSPADRYFDGVGGS